MNNVGATIPIVNMADPLPPQDLPKNPYGGNGPLLMGVTWSLTILAMILMGLRTYGNAKILQKFSWDYLWAMITLVRRTTLLRAPAALRSKSPLMIGAGSSRPWWDSRCRA